MPYFIKSNRDQGRFRGGRIHTVTGRAWPDESFTAGQLAAIKDDPALTVEEWTGAQYDAWREKEQAAFVDAVADSGLALMETLTAIRDAAQNADGAENAAPDAVKPGKSKKAK